MYNCWRWISSGLPDIPYFLRAGGEGGDVKVLILQGFEGFYMDFAEWRAIWCDNNSIQQSKPCKNLENPKKTKLQTPLGLLSDSVDMWSAVLVVSCLAFPGSLSMGLIFCFFVGLPKNTKTKQSDPCLPSSPSWVPLHESELVGPMSPVQSLLGPSPWVWLFFGWSAKKRNEHYFFFISK